MELGTRIKLWRTFKNLTVSQLAEKVGVTAAAVCHWESEGDDKTTPTQKNLIAITDAFGITMEKFYGKVPKRPAAEAA